jgi:transcriptional regulator with XRE-family HTH domain
VENKKTIRDLRIARGLTQIELAKIVGIHQVQVSYWETGRSVPSGPSLQKIATALDVDANDIELRPRKAA